MFSRLKSIFATSSSPPADEIAHKKEGDEHLRLDRLSNAADCYRRALSVNPDYVDACVALGFALSEQKQFGEAGKHLHHALSIDPQHADAHYILGTISRNANDQANAIGHFARALQAKPDFEFAHRDLIAALLDGGQIQQAKDALQRAISVYPESAEFRFNLGNVFRHQQDYDNAIASYEKALSLQPASAETHKNLADAQRERGQLDQAGASYRKALWFAPDLVDAHIELGGLMQSEGKHDEAIACYQRAIALQPERAGTQMRLGNALEKLGRTDDAIACYRRAIALEPDNASAHQFLGNSLVQLGSTEDAVACYEQVLRLDPGSPVNHLIAALSGRDSERAPGVYVEKLFDEYANKFDSHLVEVLSYSVPEKLADLLQPHFASHDEKWSILDLGCGTGLSGVAVAPYSRQLVGVDLSAKMLEKARERNLYHRLEHLELQTMMEREGAASYDVVLAADVFVYLGKLDELVDEARRVLRPGGLFAFSVESLEALTGVAPELQGQRDYQLNTTGRYAHSIAYLDRLAARNGFQILTTTGIQSRLDKGKPVEGYVALWRSPHA